MRALRWVYVSFNIVQSLIGIMLFGIAVYIISANNTPYAQGFMGVSLFYIGCGILGIAIGLKNWGYPLGIVFLSFALVFQVVFLFIYGAAYSFFKSFIQSIHGGKGKPHLPGYEIFTANRSLWLVALTIGIIAFIGQIILSFELRKRKILLRNSPIDNIDLEE